ncbi:EscU/YscU/HrcU family type III secretion system export apparatus switch protein [Roseococcus sp. YIM B11640]|uniref:EscU/YscU/HrcU family type III secretion system export apparatus switch protein n=1 Tax=Roseococcus sp. YIM B11640 TaxID=3133973 RepID=UPI003C79F070
MAEEEREDDDAERQLEASQKRIDRAREQGHVALSREAVALATLLATLACAALLLPGQVAQMGAAMRGAFSRSHEMSPGQAAREWLDLLLWLVLPVAGAAVLGAVAATLAQTRGAISVSRLVPDLGKISPMAGFGRLFSAESGIEFLRTLLKLAMVSGAFAFVASDLPALGTMLDLPAGEVLGAAGRGAIRLIAAALAGYTVLALADLLLVRFRHLEQLRMTREEMKEEHKESEGDPAIKGRMRQLRQAMSRGRMMAAVPKATVVVTNPTHYAVALSYEAGQSAAPKLVAKGADAMAARIREVAREAGVPIVPDPPLARALYKLELEDEIPAMHWEAVAKIIAHVMRLRGRA